VRCRIVAYAVRIALGALRSPGSVVIDAGDRNSAAVRIDADGLTAVVELVLSLRGAARQQDDGYRQQPFHYDLLSSRSPKETKLGRRHSNNVIQITFMI
jgi:hypothetical protein